ncbi:hypothetical protein Bca4012_103807 [Brassica carinata]
MNHRAGRASVDLYLINASLPEVGVCCVLALELLRLSEPESYSHVARKVGAGEDLTVIFVRRQACLARTRIASSHRHNISASEIPANILFTFASSAYFMQRRQGSQVRLLCSRLPHGRSIREQHFKQSLTIPSR